MTAILLYLRDTNKYIQLNLSIIHHATVLMKHKNSLYCFILLKRLQLFSDYAIIL